MNSLNLDRSEWKLVSFGDVAQKQNESVDRETTKLKRYIGGEHMRSEDLHLREWGDVGENYLGPAFTRKFSVGDILYGSRRTYLRKVAVADFEGITANTTFVIKANEGVILKELLPFVMLSEGFAQHSIRNSKGSVNPYINWKDIANYEFLLPPKDQQAKLAELLWATDEVVESQGGALGELDLLIQSEVKAFFEGPFSQCIKLKDVGQWLSGGTPSRSNKGYWNGDIPWLSPKDMKTERLGGSIERISQDAVDGGAKLLPINSILVVVRGLILAHSFPVGLNTVPAAFNQDMRALVTSEDFLPELILYFLQFKKDEVLKMTTTTTHGTKRLASDVFLGMNIPKPSLDQQGTFVDMIREHKKIHQDLSGMIMNSKQLLKSLINQIF